ncbi:MAG: hypothetical protein IKT43_04950 [Clostridia bacterium]|nr:hypothetical protein [Clostridia bacterium]
MNQTPNHPRRPVRQMPQNPRPAQNAPRPVQNTARPAPSQPRRKAPKKKLRPIAVVLLATMVLLVCIIVFAVSYKIAYGIELNRLQQEQMQQSQGSPNQNDGNTSNSNTSGGNTSDGNTSGGNTSDGNTSGGNTSGGNTSGGNTSGGNTSGGGQAVMPPAGNESFASISDIVKYVDSLGIDFTDRKSFDMSGYFKAVTLKKTADAGDAYQNETVYIGDSLVLHMGSRSNHPKSMVYGAASINPEDACVKKLAYLKNGTEATFAEAMTELQPKRIVISIGTNSMWMDPSDYLNFLSVFIKKLQAGCPNTEIILQSTPPLTAEYEAGKRFPTNEKINRFNMYLAGLATYHKVWYLNSAPELKNENGTLAEKYNSDGFHISAAGYDVWTNYLRTHATTLQGN